MWSCKGSAGRGRLYGRRGNEFLVEQRLDDAAGMHTTNLLDFGNGHRLLVRNHSQCFQRRQREPRGRNLALDESLQHFMMFGFGGESEAVCDLADLDAVFCTR